MEKRQMIIHQKLQGQVEYNDGEFAEVLTVGMEAIEKNLLLDTVQIHRSDTNDSPEEFQKRFPVGMSLNILKTTEIAAQSIGDLHFV